MDGGRFPRAGNCGFRGHSELSSGQLGVAGEGKGNVIPGKEKSVADTARVYQAPLPFPSGSTSCLVAITWGYVIVFSRMD